MEQKIKRIDKTFKTMSVKGKQYVEVKERIKYLAFDFDGDYSIHTKFWHYPETRTWVVKATLTLKQNGLQSVYSGLAQEVESDNYKDVNHTSALENCETSAIGRACAMAGIGVDISIASADEINKAMNRQTQNKTPHPTQAPAAAKDTTKEQNAAQEPGKAAEEVPVRFASNEQKEKIIELLNNAVITRQEKTKMLLNINRFDDVRAAEAIEKLKKVIEEREDGQATAS